MSTASYYVVVKQDGEVDQRENGFVVKKPFQCMECDLVFSTNAARNMHVKTHTADGKFDFTECKFITADVQPFRKHKIDGSEVKKRKSSGLKNAYRTIVKLSNTNEIEHYQCTQCEYKCRMKGLIQTHVAEKHVVSKSILVPDCDPGDEEFACPLCDYLDPDSHNMGIHIQKVHVANNNFSCIECDFESYDNEEVELHMEKEHTKKDRVMEMHVQNVIKIKKYFSCKDCDFETQNERELELHVYSEHVSFKGGFEMFRCFHIGCDFTSDTYEGIKSHVKTSKAHRNNRKLEKKYHCIYRSCSFTSFLMKGINIHVRNDHNDSKDAKDANNELIEYIMSSNVSTNITVKCMEKQIQDKTVKCEQCDFTCLTQNILNTHIGHKHGNETYQENERGECSESDYIGTDESIKCHSKTHTAVQPFTCNKCDFSCITRKVLNRHISGNHGDETNFEEMEDEIEKSSECDYVGIAKQLISHSESHKKEKCTQCNYIGTSKGLNSHSKAHKVKPFTCEQCHYSCISQKVLHTHIVRKHGDEGFKCSECDYRGISFIGLSRHLKVHNKYERMAELCLKCPICSENFINKKNSKVTQKSLPFNCEKCNISFFPAATLKKTRFICGKCNKYFKTTNKIKNHVNMGHKSFLKWSCLQCDYTCRSKNKSDIRRHNSVHEQKQMRHISVQEPKHSFICLECGLSYDDKADLISHMVDMDHTGGKPYSCTKCKVKFNSSIGLKDHMDSHDSDAPHREDPVEESELYIPDNTDSGTEILHCSDYQVKSEYEADTIFIVDPIDIKCEMIVGESEICGEENDKDCFDVKNKFEEVLHKDDDFTIMFNPENIKSEKEIYNVKHEEGMPNKSIVGIAKPVDIGEDMHTLHGCNLRI